MAIRADITQDQLWIRYQARTFRLTITDATTGNPTNLTGLDLIWRVKFDQNSPTTYLTKQSPDIQVSGASSNIALISIDPGTDYDDLQGGIHYHELWDLDNDEPLAFGDAYLHNSTDPHPAV